MYFNNCKSWDEAKNLYRELAKKLHPDLGGEHLSFIKMKDEFDNFNPDQKEKRDEFFNAAIYSAIIDQLVLIEGLKITICGNWIWVMSEKHHKDLIKAVDLPENWKRAWNKSKNMWYFCEKGYRKFSKRELSFGEIKALYGHQDVESKGMTKINT